MGTANSDRLPRRREYTGGQGAYLQRFQFPKVRLQHRQSHPWSNDNGVFDELAFRVFGPKAVC